MLLSAKLSNNLWGEALLTACHIHNRIPSRKRKVSPYEIWKGRKPNLDYLRVWGCLAYYRVSDPKRTKLGPRGIRSIFVGYAQNSKAYRFLDLQSNVIVESRDAELFEDKFSKDIIEHSHHTIEDQFMPQKETSESSKRHCDVSIEPRRSKRKRKEKNLGNEFISDPHKL